MSNYLFYSSRCESSANFIRILENKGLRPMFQLLSIDKMPTDDIIKLQMNFTPMVMIRDQTGRNTTRYEGKKAFEWLDNLIKFREQNMAKIAEANRRKILQSNQQVAKSQDQNVLSFFPHETQGVSDNFSYTSEALQEIAQPKSFMPYGKDNEHKILTLNNERNKLTERDMTNKLKDFESKHKEDTKNLTTIVESQLKQTLINKILDPNI
jgi:hypothetical protein